jgi:hypothetical protein
MHPGTASGEQQHRRQNVDQLYWDSWWRTVEAGSGDAQSGSEVQSPDVLHGQGGPQLHARFEFRTFCQSVCHRARLTSYMRTAV